MVIKFYYLLILILITVPFYSLKAQNMAYYTDLSETIEGEQYLSIYSYVNTYVPMGKLRSMSLNDIEQLLNKIGVESKHSSIDLKNIELLNLEDPNPEKLYPLSAFKRINGVIMIENIEIKSLGKQLKLNTTGEIFINDVYVANITKDYEIIDLQKNIVVKILNKDELSLYDGDFEITLKDKNFKDLVRIDGNGNFKTNNNSFEWDLFGQLFIKGKGIKAKGRSLQPELFQTASVLYYVFFEKKIITLEEIFKADVYQKIEEKIRIDYNLKVKDKLWNQNKITKNYYNFNLRFEQFIDSKTKKIETKKTISKNNIEGNRKLYDSIAAIAISIPGYNEEDLVKINLKNIELKVYQVKSIDVTIQNGKLTKSLGFEEVDKAVENKIQLDGRYNIAFNYAFLNGTQIVNTIYYTKTSLLKPRKAITNKPFELDLDSNGNPRN